MPASESTIRYRSVQNTEQQARRTIRYAIRNKHVGPYAIDQYRTCSEIAANAVGECRTSHRQIAPYAMPVPDSARYLGLP
eukprot:1909546-Rhodomonas_salina.1